MDGLLLRPGEFSLQSLASVKKGLPERIIVTAVQRPVFEGKNASRTDRGAESAADTGSADDVLAALSIVTDIDPHLAIL
jgi:hypothetical protein